MLKTCHVKCGFVHLPLKTATPQRLSWQQKQNTGLTQVILFTGQDGPQSFHILKLIILAAESYFKTGDETTFSTTPESRRLAYD